MCIGLFITISLRWRYNVRYSSFVIGWWWRLWRIQGIHERSPILHCIKWEKIWCWEMGVGMRGSECLGWSSEIWDLQPVFLSGVGTEIVDFDFLECGVALRFFPFESFWDSECGSEIMSLRSQLIAQWEWFRRVLIYLSLRVQNEILSSSIQGKVVL